MLQMSEDTNNHVYINSRQTICNWC